MTFEDIIDTFPKHKVALIQIFQTHKNLGHDHRYISHFSQFLTILDELLIERQKVEMYLKIRAELDPCSVDSITSNVRYPLLISN